MTPPPQGPSPQLVAYSTSEQDQTLDFPLHLSLSLSLSHILPPSRSSPTKDNMSVDVSSEPSTKRACDACKVRKVRCSNTTPCAGCIAIGSQCTFNRRQGTRGPRKLRAKTIHQIAESQRRENDALLPAIEAVRRTPVSTSASNQDSGPRPGPGLVIHPASERPLPPLVATPPAASPPGQMSDTFSGRRTSQPESNRGSTTITPIATLILHLCVYRLRMFPLWPIVAVEELMVALQRGGEDSEAYALANALAAATVVQLRLAPLKNSAEIVTVESMEREVQRVRAVGRMKVTSHRRYQQTRRLIRSS